MILLLLLLLPAMDASSRGESRCRLVASVTIFCYYYYFLLLLKGAGRFKARKREKGQIPRASFVSVRSPLKCLAAKGTIHINTAS